MRSAGALVLVGALIAGGVATAVVAASWLSRDPVADGSRAAPGDVPEDAAVERDVPGRTHVDPASATDGPRRDGTSAAPTVDTWVAGVCTDAGALQRDDGLDVEWWDFPLDDVVAALLAAAERDEIGWSGARALEELRFIGYLAAPWAADVARHLGDSPLAPDAVLTLAAMGPDALPVLRDAAASDDASVRGQVMLVLSEATYRRREVVELALRALDDDDASVRLAALEVLGAHDEAPELSVPALAERVAARDDATQREVMESLYMNGPRAADAVPALMGLIADHRRRRAEDAVGVLEMIGPAAESAVPSLLALIVNDPGTYSKSVPVAVFAISPDAYLKALCHEDPAVRLAFARTARSGRSDPESEARLVAALEVLVGDPDPRVRDEAIGAVEHIVTYNARIERDIQFLGILLQHSRDRASGDRVQALEKIARRGTEARVLAPAVRDMLHDPDRRVRLQAALAVWLIDPPAADVEPILRTFRDDPELRRDLYEGLTHRPPLTWSEHVVALLQDEPDSSDVIGPANDMVREMGEHALDPLIRLARSERRPERIAFIGALLYDIGEPAVPTLRELAARPGLLPPLRAELLRLAETAR